MFRTIALCCVFLNAGVAAADVSGGYEILIGGKSFEHDLGRDNWFVMQGTPAEDKTNPRHGNKCLRFDSPGQVDSQLFEYDGQELLCEGWIKARQIDKNGGAIVCLLGYDGNRKEIARDNAAVVHGSQEWTHFKKKVIFNLNVKYVVCRVMLLAGSGGRAWFDDLKVWSPAARAKNMDREKAVLTVNADKPESDVIHPIWDGVAGLYPQWLTKGQYCKETLDKAQQAGFKWLRVRGIMHQLDFYERDDDAGNPICNWNDFDEFFDAMVKERGFLLSVTIDTLPKLLTREGTAVGEYKKNYPTDFNKWRVINEAMFEHLIERYGKDEVGKWRFHVWNEPWQVDRKNDPFFKLYDGVLEAVKHVEKKHNTDIKLGLAGGAYPPFQEDIMAHVAATGNAKDIDVIAFHSYAGGSDPLDNFTKRYQLIKKMAESYGLRDDVEIWCQEYNASYSSQFPKDWRNISVNDTSFAAVVVVDAMRQWLDCGLTRATFFSLRDWPCFEKDFSMVGSCGMLTKQAIPKAAYHAFVFLNQLSDCKRIPVQAGNNPVNAIAAVSRDGRGIKIILYSIDEDVKRPPYQTDVSVNIILPDAGKTWSVTKYWRIDSDNGDLSTIWKKLGKPKHTDREIIDILRRNARFARLNPATLKPQKTAGDNITIKLPTPSASVTLIELQQD